MRLAITGHRPQGLTTAQMDGMQMYVHQMLDKANTRDTGPHTWHVGGALGTDQLVHWHLQDISPDQHIRLHSPGGLHAQGAKWTKTQQDWLAWLYVLSDGLCDFCKGLEMSETSYRADFHRRNQHMVDNADAVIAFLNERRGGTWNCVRYALDVGKPVFNAFDGFKRIR